MYMSEWVSAIEQWVGSRVECVDMKSNRAVWIKNYVKKHVFLHDVYSIEPMKIIQYFMNELDIHRMSVADSC